MTCTYMCSAMYSKCDVCMYTDLYVHVCMHLHVHVQTCMYVTMYMYIYNMYVY